MKSFYILLIAFSCYIPVSTGQSNIEPAKLGYVTLETFLELVMPVFEKRELKELIKITPWHKKSAVELELLSKAQAKVHAFLALTNSFISNNTIRTCVIAEDKLHMGWVIYSKFANLETIVLFDRLLLVSLPGPEGSVVEFPLGLANFKSHGLCYIDCRGCDSDIECLFNIFDLIKSGAFYISYEDVINFYQGTFGYNPQPYIDQHNELNYQEWLEWRNRDYVAIYPEMSTATLYQHDAHIEQPEVYAPWFPESIPTKAPTKPTT